MIIKTVLLSVYYQLVSIFKMASYTDLLVRNLEHEFNLCAELESKIRNLDSNSEDTSCPICMEDLTDNNKTTTACGHVFHSSCIFKNMMLRTTCPMCREDLVCKSIPTNANSNTNINININYNLPQNHHHNHISSELMDIDDDIINALLSQDILSQELLSPGLQYDDPTVDNDVENETDAETATETESDSIEESATISGNSSVYEDRNPEQDEDSDDDSNEFERYETDLTLSEVTNKMIELGYTPEDMFYYMTWRVNPFYFNMNYLNKYNDEFYDKMTETMHKIFSKEIPITTATSVNQENIFNMFNSRVMNIEVMTIDELN